MASWRCEHCSMKHDGEEPDLGGCVEHEIWRPGANHPFISTLHKWINLDEIREQREREAREQREKEQKHLEWLASEEGQRWQAEENRKKAEEERKEREESGRRRLEHEKNEAAVRQGCLIIAVFVLLIIAAICVFFVIRHNRNSSLYEQATAALPEQVVISFPRTGMWKLTGQDSIKWTANLVIDEIDNNSFTGHFYWWGEKKGGKRNNFGRENFRGTYDPEKRKVSIQGHSLQGNTIGIGLGKYEAFLTENGNDFESGKWTSGGVWNAKWQK